VDQHVLKARLNERFQAGDIALEEIIYQTKQNKFDRFHYGLFQGDIACLKSLV